MIYEKLIGLSNYVNPDYRIFFFDSDELYFPESKVTNIANEMQCDIFVFKSNNHGYHFISFNLFTIYECERIFNLFKVIYPNTDYYHIDNCRILNETHTYTKRTKRGYKMKDRIQVLRVSAKTSHDSYSFEGFIGCETPLIRPISIPLLKAFVQFHKECFLDETIISIYSEIRMIFTEKTYVKLIEYENSKFSELLLNQVLLSVKGGILI